jgi:hypothetical protein
MQLRNARKGHWLRLNVLDGWQVFGVVGMAAGILGFGLLLTHTKIELPRTGGAFLLQTIVGGGAQPSATDRPTASPSASPSPFPAVGLAAPVPSVLRQSPNRIRPSGSGSSGSGVTATPSPTDTTLPTLSPLPRPSIPAPIPLPTATPRPSIRP